MLGLFAFFYGTTHFLAFAWLDMGLDLDAIVRDIARRPFILVGTAALLGMLPLAATSFNRAIKALGAARWQALHRLVYAVALLGLLHFFWMRAAKNNFAEVAVYAAVLGALLGWRLWRRLRTVAAGRGPQLRPGPGR
jgi:sulfoxide reductase heme-binding subunit YedZ